MKLLQNSRLVGLGLAIALIAGCSTSGGSGGVGAGATYSKGYDAPRLANGQPDLQGTWTNVSLTQLTRPRQFKNLVITEEEAQRIEEQRAAMREQSNRPTDPNEGAPEAGGVGGYNSFWIDSGEDFAVINGEARSSWIVDPPNGQLPYTEKGRQIFAREAAHFRNHVDNPEGRPMAERCIIGFGSTGGPPMINVLYNNQYQIVQTDDAFVILVEMNHDARVIRLDDEHHPSNMRTWLGDSVGEWKGDTLVAKTKNFHEGEQLRLNFNQSFYISKDATVEEYFTRISDDEMLYEFIVTDPEIYSQPWRAEMLFKRTDTPVYEYACHEGNYALPNILSGARAEEKAAAQK